MHRGWSWWARLSVSVLALHDPAASAQVLSCAEVYALNGNTVRRLAAPYTDGASSVLLSAPALSGVNSLGLNPLDLQGLYYWGPSSQVGLRALTYIDLTASPPVAGIAASPALTVPVGASDTLAFGPDGAAVAYDYVTGTLYRQVGAVMQPLALSSLQGGGPSASLQQYVVNDLLVDASGMIYIIGLYPAGSPTTAHLIRLNPSTAGAEYVRALSLNPASTLPTGSSGLAWAPDSTDSAPKLLWSPSTGTYTVDVLTGEATRTTSTSRADLASCPRNTVVRAGNGAPAPVPALPMWPLAALAVLLGAARHLSARSARCPPPR